MWTLLAPVISNMFFLAMHVTGISVFPKPLSEEEEKHCFELMAEGDKNAKNKLIEHNLRLVAHIIKKYYYNSKEQEDLISIGTIGLIKAVSTFSYEKGSKFATYASKCIENEILMYFRSKKKEAQDVYISDPIDTDKEGHSLTLMDIVADDSDIIYDVDLKMNSDKLYKAMDKVLTKREKEIIVKRYGLNGEKALQQRIIADKLNISRSYVSRIEKRALEKLKSEMDSGDL